MIDLIKNPELRFPEFKKGWEKRKIGDFYSNLRTGMTPSRGNPEYFTGTIPWITSGELNYNHISSTKERITESAVTDTSLKIYPVGTMFIAITGLEAPGTRGKCAINAVPATTNQSCMSFEKIDEIETKFLYYWYNKYGIPLYFKFAQGTKQQSFNNKIVEDFVIYLPKIREQTKIASFLTAVDQRITLLTQQKEALEQYKKGVMQQLFSQQLRFKDENGNDFPDWEEKILGKVLSFGSGRNYKHLNSGKIPVYGTGGLMTFVDDYLYDGQSIGIGRKGTIDKPMLLNGKFWTVDTLFYTHSFKNVIPYFIYLCFQRINWKEYNEASGVPSLSKSTLEKIKIMIPSAEEQQKIASFLSSIDTKIEQVNQQIAQTKTWKKGLLQKMFV